VKWLCNIQFVSNTSVKVSLIWGFDSLCRVNIKYAWFVRLIGSTGLVTDKMEKRWNKLKHELCVASGHLVNNIIRHWFQKLSFKVILVALVSISVETWVSQQRSCVKLLDQLNDLRCLHTSYNCKSSTVANEKNLVLQSRKGDKISALTLRLCILWNWRSLTQMVISANSIGKTIGSPGVQVIKSLHFNAAAINTLFSLLLCVLVWCAGTITLIFSKNVSVDLLSAAKCWQRSCSVYCILPFS